MENTKEIKGGAFQVARKMFESELWLSKPSTWKIIWIYILGRVNHKEDSTCDRGEGFFQWTKEIKLIGNDITPDMIKKATNYFRGVEMISTKRSTRGVHIKVINYNIYQTLDSYISTKKALRKHLESTTIDKNVKNEKNTLEGQAPQYEIVKVIDSFKEVNPAFGKWYGNTNQRNAITRMIETHTLEKVLRVIAILPKTNKIPYITNIQTPCQLEDRWSTLEAQLTKEKTKLSATNKNTPNYVL
jgi:hypothetical protein